jgi:hypothetical protein
MNSCCIGLSKSGTTSLTAVLETLGYDALQGLRRAGARYQLELALAAVVTIPCCHEQHPRLPED